MVLPPLLLLLLLLLLPTTTYYYYYLLLLLPTTTTTTTSTLCDVATGWFDSRAFYRPVPVLGANEGASFSRAIEITAAVLSVRGVAAHNMALVIYHMPFLSTGIMPGGSNALVAALYRQ